MKLLTDEQHARLVRNGEARQALANAGEHGPDFFPVAKLFTVFGATWLLTEIYPDMPDLAFGLCDLGMGCPELGDVSLTELSTVRGPHGVHVERDLHFKADKPLSAYAARACKLQYIEA
jgi:hypothetical protein